MKSVDTRPSAAPALTQGFAAARVICRRAMRGIELPAAFLPRAKRDGVFSVLALCWMIRDATSTANDLTRQLRLTLQQLSTGQLELPLPEMRTPSQRALYAASQTCVRYEVPLACFVELAEALRSPLSRYATWSSLEKHCEGAGGSVARIVAAVLGLTHSDGSSRANRLGIAIELTRILRDLRADLARGRIYLPLTDLAECGYSERDFSGGVVNNSLGDLVRFQVARARALYEESAKAIPWLADDGSRIFAAAIIATGMNLLDTMEKRWRDLLSRPPQATTGRIMRSLPTAWRLARA